MSVPTNGEMFEKLSYHLAHAQEAAAMLGHLHGQRTGIVGSKDWLLMNGWLAVSEALKRMQHMVTDLARGRMQ